MDRSLAPQPLVARKWIINKHWIRRLEKRIDDAQFAGVALGATGALNLGVRWAA